MSPPTHLPSAAALAQTCAERYTQLTGTQLPDEVRADLERLADYFLELNRFHELLSFIPWGTFFRKPNTGHDAIADFLCCGALTLAATTNYDTHIEDASLELGEHDFQAALSGVEAGELPDRHHPLLKLHGCCRRDRQNTLWAHSQTVNNDLIRRRLESSTEWLGGHLTGRDLVIVGFWTDWDYLNDVLSDALAGSEPRTVVLVDPADHNALREKAPQLWNWANQPANEFFHVRERSDTFLDELRAAYSRGFIRQVLEGGAPVFARLFQRQEPVEVDLPDILASNDLYSLRKDLCGCSSTRPAGLRRPDDAMYMVGAYVVAVLAAGGTVEGVYFSLHGRAVRVINCANRLLSSVQADFANDLGTARNCDAVVCVGALDDGVPGDLVRGQESRTIVRQGWDGEWMTGESARELLGI